MIIYPKSFTKKQIKYLHIKYKIDILLGIAAAIVLLPIFAVLSLLIFIDDPGPVIFKQKRVGNHKSYFNIYKFRTMKTNTPKDVPTHLLENPEQYITRMGHFLRKTSLDELPQVFNIARGQICVCGPRPALWNQYDLIEERDKYGANDIKPGLTGWAQINGRDELEIDVKAALDGEYVKKLGLWMDMKCFFGTFASVLKSEGVVEGGTGAMEVAVAKEEDIPKRVLRKKKKLLLMTNHSFMLWQFRRELIQELLKEYTVILSMPCGEHVEDFREMGCKIIDTDINRRGINPFTDIKLLRKYFYLLKKIQPDMVITYSIKPNIYGGFACRMRKIPYCVNVQGLGTAFQKPILANIVSIMYKVALKKAKTVFFENEGNAALFRQKKILPAKKQTILRGAGINLTYYDLAPYEEKESIHFLFVGRIMKEKGVDEFFYAAKKMKKAYKEAVTFDMVGFFEDEYKEQVKNMQKQGMIEFHGFKEEVRPFYRMANCVVLPSYHEGMSNVLLEAAATGRTLITSNIPGCKEAVIDGKSGYLCPVMDGEALYQAMEKFMKLTTEQRQQMGLAGRKHMEEIFDKKKVVKETLKKIQEN
jgi:lipopolysaccharide/colanic/teichoic acid biosynthesis glycosyltransferase/glycosyltransferase involved in cell wall biosynthesis